MANTTEHILYCDARNYKKFATQFEGASNVEVKRIEITKSNVIDRFLWFFFIKTILSFILKYDVFVHHNGIYLNPFKSKKNHIILHNVQPLIWRNEANFLAYVRLYLLFFFYIISFSSSEKIILLNEAFQKRLKQDRFFKIWSNKFHFSTIHLGLPKIKVSKYTPKKNKGKIKLCYVSAYNEYKNHRFLFKCLDEFAYDVSLLCLGIPKNNLKFQKLASSHRVQIEHNITSHDNVSNELNRFDGLIFLSSVENLPKTIFDYAYAEKPLFLYELPEIVDIFEGENNITWLKNLNQNEFKVQFDKFLSNIRKGEVIFYETSDKYNGQIDGS